MSEDTVFIPKDSMTELERERERMDKDQDIFLLIGNFKIVIFYRLCDLGGVIGTLDCEFRKGQTDHDCLEDLQINQERWFWI